MAPQNFGNQLFSQFSMQVFETLHIVFTHMEY